MPAFLTSGDYGYYRHLVCDTNFEMPIYLLTPLGDNIPLAKAVVEGGVPPSDRWELPNGRGWLISHRGTSIELSNHLGITGQPENVPPSLSPVLITSVNSYYGRSSSDLWEWLKVRFENAS